MSHHRLPCLAAATALLLSPGSRAAPGDLDCSFGAGGIVTRDFVASDSPFNGTDGAKDAVLQSTGRIVALGHASGTIRLSRFLADGSLDGSFAGGGSIVHALGVGHATTAAVDGQDRILVVGRIDDPDQDAYVARFTADGAVDASFGGGDGWASFDLSAATDGVGNEAGFAIAVDALDRPVIAGFVDPNGNVIHPSNADVAVARLTEAGALDASFSGDGVATASTPSSINDDRLRALRVDAAGRIVAVGDTYYPQPSNHNATNSLVVRWNADGTLDATLGGTGVLVLDLSQDGSWDGAVDLALAPGGKLLVLATSGGDDPTLALLDEDGSFDTSFGGGDGIVRQSFLGGQDVTERVLVQANGSILVTGWPVVGNSFHFASMRFTSDGTLDSSWGGDGVVTTSLRAIDRGYAGLLQEDGKLLMVGGLDNDVWFGMARYLNDDHLPPTGSIAISADAPDPSTAGAPVEVAWSITTSDGSTPGGTVTVGDGTDSCTAPASAGSCVLAPTTVGSRTLVASWSGDACVAGADSPGEPHTVLAPPEWTVTPVAGAGGTLSPGTPQRVTEGQSVQFTVAADAGYRVESVAGCGGSLAGGVFTTAVVTADCAVTASFDRNPVALAGTLETLEDTPAAGVLQGEDDDPLQFTLDSPPSRGSVVLIDPATGAFEYTPAADANGSDSFTFRVNDGDVLSAPATVSVDVGAVNDAPAATLTDLPTHAAGTVGPRNVLGFASFDAGPPDEDALQSPAWLVEAVDDPDGVLEPGSVALSGDGALAFALTGMGGSALVSVRVRDDGGTADGGMDLSAAAGFEISVAPGADLQLSKDNGQAGLLDGAATVYAIVVANAGPNAVEGATLTDLLPAALTDAAWACVPAASTAACPASGTGTGDLVASIDLPAGTHLRFDLSAVVDGNVGAFVTNTAQVAAPEGTVALDAGNDSATDSDPVVTVGLFLDGFEAAPAPLTVPGAEAARRP